MLRRGRLAFVALLCAAVAHAQIAPPLGPGRGGYASGGGGGVTEPGGTQNDAIQVKSGSTFESDDTCFIDSTSLWCTGKPFAVYDFPLNIFFQADSDTSTPSSLLQLATNGAATGLVTIVFPTAGIGNATRTVIFAQDMNTEAKLEAFISAALISSTEMDTVGELQSLVGGVDFLLAPELDTLAEWASVVGVASTAQALVLASPAGSTGSPTFRALAETDLPAVAITTPEVNTTVEARDSGAAFMPEPNDGAGCGDGLAGGLYDAGGSTSCFTPITDFSDLTSRNNPDLFPVNPIVTAQAGSPVGTEACDATAPSEVGRKLYYDTTNGQPWICTGSGNDATATWARLVKSDAAGLFWRTACMALSAPTGSTADVPIWIAERATTVRKLGCVCQGANCGTPAQIRLEDDAGDSIGTATCGTTSTTWADVSADADAALPANESARVDVTNTPTASGQYQVCIAYTVDGY